MQELVDLLNGCQDIRVGKEYKNFTESYARTQWKEDFKIFTQTHLPEFAAHQDENYFELPNS